jgi:hypothetical protein
MIKQGKASKKLTLSTLEKAEKRWQKKLEKGKKFQWYIIINYPEVADSSGTHIKAAYNEITKLRELPYVMDMHLSKIAPYYGEFPYINFKYKRTVELDKRYNKDPSIVGVICVVSAGTSGQRIVIKTNDKKSLLAYFRNINAQKIPGDLDFND